MQIAWRPPRDAETGEPEAPAVVDDGALVAVAQVRPAAFTALWERYYDPIFRYCRFRLPSWEEAEDAANEIFTDAFAGLARFDTERDTFRSWLFAIAHNEVISRQRRHGLRRFVPFAELFSHASTEVLPEEAALTADETARALKLLAHFPAEQRRVLELRWAGLSGKEIATVLGKRYDAVRKIESRAEQRLRELRKEARDGE